MKLTDCNCKLLLMVVICLCVQYIGVNTGGTRPPRIRSGGDANVIRSPPDFGHLDICCVMNHSAVHRCLASDTAHRLVPAVG